MHKLEVSLIEWPSDPHGGPRLLGRTNDPALIEDVRARILEDRRAEVARLETEGDGPRLRAVRPPDDEDPT